MLQRFDLALRHQRRELQRPNRPPAIISFTAVVTVIGRPMPPNSGCADMPIQPPSAIALNPSANPGEVRTTPFSKYAGVRSPLRFNGAILPALRCPASFKTAATTSFVAYSKQVLRGDLAIVHNVIKEELILGKRSAIGHVCCLSSM